MMFQLMAPEAIDSRTMPHAVVTGIEPEDGGVEHPEVAIRSIQSGIQQKEEIAKLVACDQVKLLAAIPEALPSSRRADNIDQANLERVEKLKAARNLDASYDQSTIDSNANSILHLSKDTYC
jgi:hypothetical protein